MGESAAVSVMHAQSVVAAGGVVYQIGAVALAGSYFGFRLGEGGTVEPAELRGQGLQLIASLGAASTFTVEILGTISADFFSRIILDGASYGVDLLTANAASAQLTGPARREWVWSGVPGDMTAGQPYLAVFY